MTLDIIIIDGHNVNQMVIGDASLYDHPKKVSSPTMEITPPGFDEVVLSFVPTAQNIYNSVDMGIDLEPKPLPDGIYQLRYSVSPSADNFVEKSIMRVDRLQEKFDEAFMTLEIMECDQALKDSSKTKLMKIYFLIQGSIAAANECAIIESCKLYSKAEDMLKSFMNSNCGCK